LRRGIDLAIYPYSGVGADSSVSLVINPHLPTTAYQMKNIELFKKNHMIFYPLFVFSPLKTYIKNLKKINEKY
jgi:hypothetical protein